MPLRYTYTRIENAILAHLHPFEPPHLCQKNLRARIKQEDAFNQVQKF